MNRRRRLANFGGGSLSPSHHPDRPGNGRTDLVLTDVVMPQVGARELVKRLATEYPGLPVIWISGHPHDAASPTAARPAPHPFLQKPIPADVLVRTVEAALGRRGSAEADSAGG